MTAVILHRDTERTLILAIRALLRRLSESGISCTPVYPLWGMADGTPYLALKGRISSLAIASPACSGRTLLFPATLSLKDGSCLSCPIVFASASKAVTFGLGDDASFPLFPRSFRIADAAIEEARHTRTWHANASYWVKTRG